VELHARKHGPNDKYDTLRCVRADGSSTETAMPRQGALPHDLIHAVVESAFGFTDGFMGLVAKGADISLLAKDFVEHIDPVRLTQAAQAESVVEALQTQLWAGAFDAPAFRYGVETTCAMRQVPAPDLTDCAPEADLYNRAINMNAAWQSVASGNTWSLRFPLETAPLVPA
jgi:hypothetical protein